MSGAASQKGLRCQLRIQNHPVPSGLVVRRPISASPAGLKVNPSFFSLLLMFLMVVLLRSIFPILFRLSNHQIADQRN